MFRPFKVIFRGREYLNDVSEERTALIFMIREQAK
jgi:hypothetical protein